jgi:hypothetical protein
MTKILIDRAVVEQALEALEPYADIKPRDWKTDREKLWRSYDALRTALAEQADDDRCLELLEAFDDAPQVANAAIRARSQS